MRLEMECVFSGGHLVWFADFPFVLPLGICLLLQCINAGKFGRIGSINGLQYLLCLREGLHKSFHSALFISLSILVDHLIRTEFDLMKIIAKYKKVSECDCCDLIPVILLKFYKFWTRVMW